MPNDPDQILIHLSRAARWLIPLFSAPTLVALAVYMGLHRYNAVTRHYGMSVGLLNPTFTDYIEKGIKPAALSVGLTAGIGLAMFLAHAGIRRLARGARLAIGTGCVVVGSVALVLGAIGMADLYVFSTTHPVPPMLVAAAVNLMPYGLFLCRRAVHFSALAGSAIAASIILIDTFLALWIMGVYARNSGLAAAGEVDGQRPVTLCAGRDLALPIPAAEDDRSGCRYRYGELRQIACGEDACMFLRRERNGSRTVVLVRLDNDVVVVGTPPPRRRSPAL